jgi:lipoprotein-anchoring transpeptidase ErfK/SrfK
MLGSPRASLEYFLNALKINSDNKRAHQGMRWAIRRGLSSGVIDKPAAQDYLAKAAASGRKNSRWSPLFKFASLASFALVTGIGLWTWEETPDFMQLAFHAQNAAVISADASPTTFAGNQEPTQTNTPLPTSTLTPSPTNTIEPSPTLLPSPTATAPPTEMPTQVPPQVILPDGVEERENWVDVDLTNQTLTAYQGEIAVRTFVVSTGTYQYPTVTGQYKIYIKYESAPMSGPGYYLPGVPYIMYFYKGYGLHGTYWHNNFGTPMSHGCVNMTVDDSRWMFGFTQIGTLVNVHY